MNSLFTLRSLRQKSTIIYLLVFLFICKPLLSYSCVAEDFIFEQVLYEDNQPFGIVESFQQDSTGFIWIGTKEGLFRYDGIRFRKYLFNREDTSSLSNNVVRKIFIDSRNNLWVATEFGLNRYITEQDCFIRYLVNNKDKKSIPGNFVTKIVEDKQGFLWMSTLDAGLIKLDMNTYSYTMYSTSSVDAQKTSNNFFNTVYLSKNGTVWLGSGSNGVEYFNPGANSRSLPSGKCDGAHLYGRDVKCIIEDAKGNLWFGTNGNGISVYDISTKTFRYFIYQPNVKGSIGSNIISDFYIDSENRLWVCTDGGGLNLYNSAEDNFIQYRQTPTLINSISSDIVRTIFEDHAGNLWIGSYNAPINYIDCHRKKFHTLRNIPGCSNCLSGNSINTVFQDSKGLVWIGIDGKGINVFDPVTCKFTLLKSPAGSSSLNRHDKPLCFAEDKEKNIWIGLFEGGVSHYNRRTGKFINYFPDGTNNNPLGSQIWNILCEGDSIWMATEKGISIFNRKDQKFIFVPVDPEHKKGTNVHGTWFLFKDSKGRILIGTLSGLNVYDPKSRSFQYFESDMTNSKSLSDRRVNCIFEDSKQRIWIGTNGGGLNLWVQPDNMFKCITSKDGLSGDIVSGIEEDAEGNLWLATNSGLTKLNYDSWMFANYSVKDGLQGNRFHLNATTKTNDGILYFGGINGLTYFNPKEIKPDTFLPPVVITGLSLFNSRVNSNSPGSPLQKNIVFEKEIKFSYKQSVFTIDFAALSYAQPEDNLYSYKLEGIDDDWRPAGHKSSATYTHLKPGKYTFKVIGSNNDKIWNKTGASVDIIISPPFYKTKVFIVLETIAAILLLIFIYSLRGKAIRNTNFKLSHLVQERTSLLELKNQEIEEQNKEIIQQRDIATSQRDQIIKQNEELEIHRNRLAELVELRTEELLEAKKKAEDNDKLKTVFLEIINQEIRTPMNAILGFINLLGERIDDANSRSFYLRILNESGKNLMRLIEDINDFSRFHLGQLKVNYQVCNLNDLIKPLIGSYREWASRERPEINILLDLPTENVLVNSDAKKILQIYNHLIDNSMKFTDKGFIKLGISEHTSEYITLFVEDSGRKISDDTIEGFFERFYQSGHDNHDIQQRDSGLGLALAKHLTELLGGKIWIENKENGFGFYFSIPANLKIDSNSGIDPSVKSSSYFWPGKKIIIAEDDETNYLLIEAIFKDTGVELLHAEDGVEFLECIENNPKVDLVLLDIRMPRLNGLNAIKIVRETMKDVPVIAQTAYDHGYHREKAFESGCNHFLTKPLIKEELLNVVKTYLG